MKWGMAVPVAALMLTSATDGLAQDYPTRPIKVITATSAGGTSDIFMRVMGKENRAAAGRIVKEAGLEPQ
jgi:tripartite-type tricarboxylate transporter receptor subunit TctC